MNFCFAQLQCSDGFIFENDTTVCKGSFVTLSALKARNHHSLHFDGINDFVQVFNDASLNVDTALTIECWFKPDTVSFMYLISKGPDTTKGWYGLGRYPQNVVNGNAFLGIRTLENPMPAGPTISSSPLGLSNNGWYHICGTYDNNIIRFYLNGVLVVETTYAATLTNNNKNLFIGKHQYNAPYDYFTKGNIDEVRIWKRALTQTEIQDKIQRHLVGSEETDLLAYYDFEDGNGLFALDRSGNLNNGILINGPQWSDEVPFTYYSNTLLYSWSSGSTEDTVTYNISNDITYYLTISDGVSNCNDSIHIYVFEGPQVQASGSLSFCEGGSVTLTASIGTSYLWNNGDTTQSIIIDSTGNFYVQIADTNSCNNFSSIYNVVVNPIPNPQIILSGDSIFCTGSSVDLSILDIGNYLWSNGATTQSVTITQSGTYSMIFTSDSSCVGLSDTVIINTVPAVVSGSIVGPVTVNPFINYTYFVSQNIGNTYSWTITNGAIVSGQGTNSISVVWNDVDSGSLSLVESNSICDDSTSIQLDIYNSIDLLNPLALSIHPNPVNNYFIVDGLANDSYTLTINNILGEIIYQQLVSPGNNKISIDKLPNSTYFIGITKQDGIKSIFQIVKQ